MTIWEFGFGVADRFRNSVLNIRDPDFASWRLGGNVTISGMLRLFSRKDAKSPRKE